MLHVVRVTLMHMCVISKHVECRRVEREQMNVVICPTFPDLRNNIAFSKDSRLRPFVLPVRAICS